MAKIYIEPAKARATLSQQMALERALQALSQDVGGIRSGLNYKISGREAIGARLRDAVNQLSKEADSTKALRTGLEQIIVRYEQAERSNTDRVTAERGLEEGQPNYNQRIQNIVADLSRIALNPSIIKLLMPFAPLELLLGGIFLPESNPESSSVATDWFGYELADGHPGVTAWLGKASGNWGSASGNAYLGKVKMDADADAHFMEQKTKKKYIDGEWTEKETFSVIDVSAKVGAAVSAIAVDGKIKTGDDYLGLVGSFEGSAGNATAEAKGEFSIGDDGVNVNLSGKAMVSAVEGKASGTINILGLEITGKIGGYAGAAGVEGKVGIEDNKFVLEGGAAALLGVSGGIEIGFNDTGWSNFWDMITFWD